MFAARASQPVLLPAPAWLPASLTAATAPAAAGCAGMCCCGQTAQPMSSEGLAGELAGYGMPQHLQQHLTLHSEKLL